MNPHLSGRLSEENPFIWIQGRDQISRLRGEMLIKMIFSGEFLVVRSGARSDEGIYKRFLGEWSGFLHLQ